MGKRCNVVVALCDEKKKQKKTRSCVGVSVWTLSASHSSRAEVGARARLHLRVVLKSKICVVCTAWGRRRCSGARGSAARQAHTNLAQFTGFSQTCLAMCDPAPIGRRGARTVCSCFTTLNPARPPRPRKTLSHTALPAKSESGSSPVEGVQANLAPSDLVLSRPVAGVSPLL
jgi:hypothetical protein